MELGWSSEDPSPRRNGREAHLVDCPDAWEELVGLAQLVEEVGPAQAVGVGLALQVAREDLVLEAVEVVAPPWGRLRLAGRARLAASYEAVVARRRVLAGVGIRVGVAKCIHI